MSRDQRNIRTETCRLVSASTSAYIETENANRNMLRPAVCLLESVVRACEKVSSKHNNSSGRTGTRLQHLSGRIPAYLQCLVPRCGDWNGVVGEPAHSLKDCQRLRIE